MAETLPEEGQQAGRHLLGPLQPAPVADAGKHADIGPRKGLDLAAGLLDGNVGVRVPEDALLLGS